MARKGRKQRLEIIHPHCAGIDIGSRARLARMDTAKAIKATAHQLARLIHAMLTQGQPYVEQGIEAFEVRSQARQLRALQRKAARFGLTLVDAA